MNTHPKTNMSPENQWLEDVFPTEIGPVVSISLYLYRLLIHIIRIIRIHQLFRVVLLKPPSVFHGLKPGVSVFVSPEFPWIHPFTR